jgi:hypothetical protein
MSGRPYAGEGGLRGKRGFGIDLNRPKYTVLHVAGAGWIVLDPQGVKCSPPVDSRHTAQARCDALQAEADRRAKRGCRPCMCCRAVFESAGIHNRLCPSCKGPGAEASPHAMVLPRRRTS